MRRHSGPPCRLLKWHDAGQGIGTGMRTGRRESYLPALSQANGLTHEQQALPYNLEKIILYPLLHNEKGRQVHDRS